MGYGGEEINREGEKSNRECRGCREWDTEEKRVTANFANAANGDKEDKRGTADCGIPAYEKRVSVGETQLPTN